MLCHDANGNIWLALSDINGAFDSNHGAITTWCSGHFEILVGDFNGDAIDDLLCHRPTTGYTYIYTIIYIIIINTIFNKFYY